MLHREIPFLRIGVPLCAGIITGLWFIPCNLFFLFSSVSLTGLFAGNYIFRKRFTDIPHGLLMTFAMWLLGLFIYSKEKESISTLPLKPQVISGTLSEFPEEKENSFKIILRLNSRLESIGSIPLNGSILLYQRKNTNVLSWLPGDQLLLRCNPVNITSRGNPYEFDYSFYMENQGIKYYAFTDSTDIISTRTDGSRRLTHRALIIREKIIDMFRQRGITGDRLALVSAITLGQKNLLDPDQKQYFMKAGVMHIMAVSGLHTVILSLFIFNILFFLKGRLNFMRVLITILILWLFAFITGLTPSVMRATLMFSFLQAGKLMKRPVNGVNSILASAFVLILIRPSVIFDAGFLLSYSAVIFIVSFYQELYLRLSFKKRIPDLIWKSVAVSIIAQLGTLPLTVLLFNRFPVWFILSNVVIVPLSSIVVILGCIVPLTFNIEFLSKFLAGILSFLTDLTEDLTRIASNLPFATIENIGSTTIECILLIITIFLLTHHILKKEGISPVFPLLALFCLVFAGTFKRFRYIGNRELIVYNSPDRTVIGVRAGRMLHIYSDTTMPDQQVTRHYATLGLERDYKQLGPQPLLIKTGKDKILITRTLNIDLLEKSKPGYVILTGNRSPKKPDYPINGHQIKGLIFTSWSGSGIQPPGRQMMPRADTIHYIRKNGGFRLKL